MSVFLLSPVIGSGMHENMNFPCALLALSWLDGGARRKCTIKNSQGGKKYLKPIFCFIVPRVSCPKKSVQPVFLHSLTKLAFTGVKKMLEICSDLWQNCAIKIATKCWWHLTNTRLIRQVFCFRLCLWLLFSVVVLQLWHLAFLNIRGWLVGVDCGGN